MSEQSCANCRYGIGFDEELGGECHRFPPVPLQTKEIARIGRIDITQTTWPFVRSDDWCGEWRSPLAPVQIGRKRE